MNLIDEATTSTLIGTLVGGVLAASEANRLNTGTTAALLGLTAARLNALKASLKRGEVVNIRVGVFLRARQFLNSIDAAREAGVLPASSTRGAAQTNVLAWYGMEPYQEQAEPETE